MLRVGVHPHVIRLLESYEDCEGEDVLILEFCEHSTVFEAYATARRSSDFLPEMLVAKLIRQLLLALEHINTCGIEHQDVKPENMMLYDFNLAEQRAELKLGDFGWAVASPGIGCENPEVPADGAGSLWYAPPELNPPVAALGGKDGEIYKRLSQREAGRSDMWSVGVVTYLLLVGHNPFHLAQQKGNSKSIEQEVLRMVALGQVDKSTARWKALQPDAHDFIEQMLRVSPGDRISIIEALKHPYLLRRLRGCAEVAPLSPPCDGLTATTVGHVWTASRSLAGWPWPVLSRNPNSDGIRYPLQAVRHVRVRYSVRGRRQLLRRRPTFGNSHVNSAQRLSGLGSESAADGWKSRALPSGILTRIAMATIVLAIS
jgi:serine/threonine protein kinase